MDEILIVDDEPMIRSMMDTALSSMGYSVTGAGSVEEAIVVVRKRCIAIRCAGYRLQFGGWNWIGDCQDRAGARVEHACNSNDRQYENWAYRMFGKRFFCLFPQAV